MGQVGNIVRQVVVVTIYPTIYPTCPYLIRPSLPLCSTHSCCVMTSAAIRAVLVAALLATIPCYVWAQENAQTRIANSLVECYQDSLVFERDNRLPMTSQMLIELIRKVEDSNEFTGDIRQLAVQMVHRFRQDGIERAPGVFSSPTIIPFSPSGFQFSKHRILLSRLLQGNAISFPNATLTTQERVWYS